MRKNTEFNNLVRDEHIAWLKQQTNKSELEGLTGTLESHEIFGGRNRIASFYVRDCIALLTRKEHRSIHDDNRQEKSILILKNKLQRRAKNRIVSIKEAEEYYFRLKQTVENLNIKPLKQSWIDYSES